MQTEMHTVSGNMRISGVESVLQKQDNCCIQQRFTNEKQNPRTENTN